MFVNHDSGATHNCAPSQPWIDRGSGVNQFRKAADQVYQLMSSPQGLSRCTSGTMNLHYMMHYNCGDLRCKAETEVHALK